MSCRDRGGWSYSSTLLNLGTRWRWTLCFTLGDWAPNTHWTGGWAGLRYSLGPNVKNLYPCLESNLDCSAHNLKLFSLQIVIAASVLSSCVAVERYPDPINCTKYYLRNRDSSFSHQTCPKDLLFEGSAGLCTQNGGCTGNGPDIRFIGGTQCSGYTGYYCNDDDSTFAYCTYDNKVIRDNIACPAGTTRNRCRRPYNVYNNPCSGGP
jgi:hypothetical protein